MRESPLAKQIDDVCAKFRSKGIEAVIAIGGGSVIDAGSTAMSSRTKTLFSIILREWAKGLTIVVLRSFIAVPTTSGTGSELPRMQFSEVASNGYKKSLRHENFIPDYILVDGELLTSCPRHVSAACGMDALTQL